jgi:hypothetical protein
MDIQTFEALIEMPKTEETTDYEEYRKSRLRQIQDEKLHV